MAKLYFKVGSDWEEVVRLRNEIAKLKQELMSMDGTQSPAAFKALNVQLAASNQRLDELVTNAAKAGAEMETGFKKGIYDGEKAVNSLSEEIIKQKDIIRETQNDVSMLTEQYKKLGKYDPKRQSLSDELNRAKAALGEQKYALGELQSQQALARLSTKALKDEYALFKDESKAVVTVNEGVGVSFKKTLAAIGGIAMLKQVASNVVSTAGMFQKYESVLTNALNGSSEKAKAYLSDINSFAAKTNFQLDELTDDFIKFVNRGITPSMDAMKKMGDFTNTVAKPFDQLTEAILDINNPERWKEFGVRVQTEGNKVKLSFRDMTVECDRTVESVMKAVEQFGSMKGVEGSTEAIAKTIEGQMSNFEDTITTALAEIGLANQDLISGSISVADTVVKNYEVIGQSVLALVSIYGVYRTGLLVNSIVEQGFTKAIWGKVAATKAATVAQATYNKVLAMNPYVLAGTAIVSLGIAMWTLADNTSIAEKAQERFNKKQEESAKQEKERKQKIEGLIQSSRDIALADLQRGQSLAELRKEYPKIFSQYDIESIKLADILELKRQIAEEDSKRAGERVAKDFEAANKAVSDYENTLSAKQINGGKLTQQEISKLKELRFYRDEFLVERGKGISEQFISSLKDVDISKFDEYISELEKRIKGKDGNGKVKMKLPIDVEGSLSDEAIYEVKDIKNLIDTAKSTKQTRIETEKNKTTYQQDLAAAKADWEKAKKGYEVLLKDQEATSEQVKDAKGKMEAAEKKYKDLGGITGSSLTKQENQAKKEAAKQLKQQELLAEQLLSIRRKNQQDEINLMEDGTEKKLAQIDLDYRKELDAIKKQRKDWETEQGGKLTDKQEEKLGTWASNAAKKRESDIDSTSKAKLEADKKAWQEYFIEYGNYQEKRKNLVQKYNDEIVKLQTDSPEYASKVAQKNKALEQLDEQFGHSTKAMADLFEDTSNKSVSAIQSIIDKYETLVKYMSGTKESDGTNVTLDELKALGFTDKDIEKIEKGEISIKDITDAIRGLKDELKGKSPWQAFISDLEKGIEAIKKGGNDSKKIGQGITDIGNTVTSFAPALNEFGSSIADIFGFDDSKITSAIDALGGLGQTASGVGQIMSGDIVGGAMSAVSGISSVVSALDGMFGADYSHYNEMVEEYTRLNEIWDELIDKKQEYISISYGMEADKVGEEALGLVEKQIEAYRLLGKERLNSGASVGSHSIGKRMVKNTSSGEWQDIASALDMSVQAAKEFIGTGRMTGLFDLTTEQLEKLKSEAPAFWAKMDGDVQEYLNGIIDGEERIEDIQNQISEQLTQTTFDSVFDSFVDTLMDMGSSAKDFSDSFSGYMQRAVLTTMVGNKFTEDLQTWYDAFAQANKDQGGITKEEMEALRKQYDAIAGSALAERDKLAEIFGWTKEDTDSSTDNYEDFIGSMQSSLTSLDVTAKDVSDNIYDYFRQAMIKALYEKEYKGRMEELYKTFEELSQDGLSESDMVQLGSQVDRYIEQMMKGVEGVNSIFTDKLKDAEDLQPFVDNVKSAMSSIEATAEDITDNIFEYIRQQMVERMFSDTFQPQIEEFYKRVQKAMSDGDITDAERNTLRSEAEKLANDIVAAKDILSDTLGITESNMKKELEEEFKSFSDGILNSLTNAEVTAEAVAKNISESMRKELIEAMYVEQYEPRIKAIWEKWKEYSEDGLVTDEERANIKNDIDELSKEVADAAGEISDVWKDSGEEVRKAFDSFSDSIRSVLYDAEATAEDVADNIYKFMRNALVDSMFSAQLQPQIQAWYDQYTEFMKDGAIDTAERKTLDEMIAEIQKAGVDIVDAANALFPSLDTGAINRAEEAAQEAENARNEAEQEWESFSDGILNSLYDIEATAEEISDDMGEYMRKALIKAMYVENFKPQMQRWYNEWQKAMGDDNLTSEEKQLLDSMKQTMADDMKKEVDAINQFFGTMFSQQASSKGYETVSQDTGEEISGRATAIYESSEGIRAETVQQTDLLSSINNKLSLLNLSSEDIPILMSGSSDIANRNKEVIANSYQQHINIVFPTDDLRTLTDKVSNMERIVDEMRTFQVEGNMDRRDILENSVILAKNSPRILDNTNDIKQDIKNL